MPMCVLPMPASTMSGERAEKSFFVFMIKYIMISTRFPLVRCHSSQRMETTSTEKKTVQLNAVDVVVAVVMEVVKQSSMNWAVLMQPEWDDWRCIFLCNLISNICLTLLLLLLLLLRRASLFVEFFSRFMVWRCREVCVCVCLFILRPTK